MMMNTTMEQLRELRLPGMATGLQEQLSQAGMTALSFEERFSLLVERELHWRTDKRQARLLKEAKLKYSQASIEDLNTGAGRGLERKAVMSLALGDWIASGHSVLITGATGVGKSWLACALAQYACRQGHSAFYQRVPRLSEELRIRHGNGTFGKWLLQLAKTDVLLLDSCEVLSKVKSGGRHPALLRSWLAQTQHNWTRRAYLDRSNHGRGGHHARATVPEVSPPLCSVTTCKGVTFIRQLAG